MKLTLSSSAMVCLRLDTSSYKLCTFVFSRLLAHFKLSLQLWAGESGVLTIEVPDVHELALHGSTTKEAGVLAVQFTTTRDAVEGVHISSTFEGCGSRLVTIRSGSSVSVTIIWDSGVVTTVLDDVASGLATTDHCGKMRSFFSFLCSPQTEHRVSAKIKNIFQYQKILNISNTTQS